MKNLSIMVIIFLAISAGLWGLRSTFAQEQTASGAAVKIGVVNVGQVLTECQANMDRDKETERRSQEIQEKLQQLEQEIQSLEQELKTALKPGSPEHQKQMQEWFNKRALQEAYEKGQREVLGAEVQAWVESLYDTMLAEVARVARANELNLVLYKEITDEKPQKLAELYKMIQNRKMLYSSPTLDITGQVIENMDKAYDKKSSNSDS